MVFGVWGAVDVRGWRRGDTTRVSVMEGTTLVAGSSFVVSRTNGDIVPGNQLGAYFRATRFISEWLVSLNGEPFEAFTVPAKPDRATFVGEPAESPLVMERTRQLGSGLQEGFSIRNSSADTIECAIDLRVGADFATVSEVEGGGPRRELNCTAEATATGLRIQSEWHSHTRSLEVLAPDAIVRDRTLHYDVIVPAHGEWQTTIIATPKIDDRTLGTYQAPGL